MRTVADENLCTHKTKNGCSNQLEIFLIMGCKTKIEQITVCIEYAKFLFVHTLLQNDVILSYLIMNHTVLQLNSNT